MQVEVQMKDVEIEQLLAELKSLSREKDTEAMTLQS